jgi:hypothetical protein
MCIFLNKNKLLLQAKNDGRIFNLIILFFYFSTENTSYSSYCTSHKMLKTKNSISVYIFDLIFKFLTVTAGSMKIL